MSWEDLLGGYYQNGQEGGDKKLALLERTRSRNQGPDQQEEKGETGERENPESPSPCKGKKSYRKTGQKEPKRLLSN